MNGIEKITDKILADAREYENTVTAEAKAKADKILSDFRSQAEQILASSNEAVGRVEAEARENAHTAAGYEEKRVLLAAKSEEIDRVFDAASEKLASMEGEEYYSFMEAMLRRTLSDRVRDMDSVSSNDGDEHESSPDCSLVLSVRDREAIGKKLIDAVAGTTDRLCVKLSDRTCVTRAGFILIHGNLEINCTSELIIASLREELEPQVNSVLFG